MVTRSFFAKLAGAINIDPRVHILSKTVFMLTTFVLFNDSSCDNLYFLESAAVRRNW